MKKYILTTLILLIATVGFSKTNDAKATDVSSSTATLIENFDEDHLERKRARVKRKINRKLRKVRKIRKVRAKAFSKIAKKH